MVITPYSDEITCLLRNVHIIINKALIRDILELEMCETQVFLHKTHPMLEGNDPTEACYRVMGKNFENITKLSANQLNFS